MKWEVEYTKEFEEWWRALSKEESKTLAVSIGLLWERGPLLGFPHSSSVNGSKYGAMRELRTQNRGRPLRTVYIFDPRRTAVLLLGGDKTGDKRWYETNIPKADRIYARHLKRIENGGNHE